ncbi:hypothetical protein [Desulfatiferula olefinivorans]
MKRYVCHIMVGLALVGVFGPVRPVCGYVPGTAQIVDQYLKTVGVCDSLTVEQEHVVFDSTLETGMAVFKETVSYLFPNRFRSDIRLADGSGGRTLVTAPGRALVLVDGRVSADRQSGFDVYKDVLLFRNSLLFTSALERLGIDGTQTRLDRFEDRVVFVIGGRDTRGHTIPALFLDKKTFLPLRLVITGSADHDRGDLIEILYLDWKKYGKTKYPSRIECFRNHVLERDIRVEKILIDPPLDEAVFDVTAIRAQAVEADTPAVTAAEPDSEDQVEKTIDELGRIIDKDPLAF